MGHIGFINMKKNVSARTPLTNEQIQVILTGKFGDGCLATNSMAKAHPESIYSYYYCTSSIYSEYIQFKKDILGNLCNTGITYSTNRGYKTGNIYKLYTISHPLITEIAHETLEESLLRMDELGFAMWIYDDGSLHKDKHFYNINTQAFSREENADIIVPFLKQRFDITAVPTIERKTDGRCYWYLRVKKYDGAFIISEILLKHFVPCLSYKRINPELVNNWHILKNNLSICGVNIDSMHPKTITAMLKRI